jgi:hypothetical protein
MQCSFRITKDAQTISLVPHVMNISRTQLQSFHRVVDEHQVHKVTFLSPYETDIVRGKFLTPQTPPKLTRGSVDFRDTWTVDLSLIGVDDAGVSRLHL